MLELYHRVSKFMDIVMVDHNPQFYSFLHDLKSENQKSHGQDPQYITSYMYIKEAFISHSKRFLLFEC